MYVIKHFCYTIICMVKKSEFLLCFVCFVNFVFFAFHILFIIIFISLLTIFVVTNLHHIIVPNIIKVANVIL